MDVEDQADDKPMLNDPSIEGFLVCDIEVPSRLALRGFYIL